MGPRLAILHFSKGPPSISSVDMLTQRLSGKIIKEGKKEKMCVYVCLSEGILTISTLPCDEMVDLMVIWGPLGAECLITEELGWV